MVSGVGFLFRGSCWLWSGMVAEARFVAQT